MSATATTGCVALVGAGPGDPALLTIRAVELLRAADVVAHDELVSEAILAMVPARAELLAVGRRIGKGTVAHRLHPEVKARALRGQRVVRLKAGDPLVFGRGGEEAEELAEAGIPFEIVPGVSAALGAAAYAGVPLTHRDHSAQLVLTTGHRADGGLPPPATLGGRTLALYMSAHELAANLAAIVESGWPPSTPAALVVSATNADECVVRATLATLADAAAELEVPRPRQPALVVVGDVLEVRSKIEWRRALPLKGRLVLLASTTSDADASRMLRDRGALVIGLPPDDAPAKWPARVDAVVLRDAPAARALYAEAPVAILDAPAIAMDRRTREHAVRFGARDVHVAAIETVDALMQRVVEVLTPTPVPAALVEAAQ